MAGVATGADDLSKAGFGWRDVQRIGIAFIVHVSRKYVSIVGRRFLSVVGEDWLLAVPPHGLGERATEGSQLMRCLVHSNR